METCYLLMPVIGPWHSLMGGFYRPGNFSQKKKQLCSEWRVYLGYSQACASRLAAWPWVNHLTNLGLVPPLRMRDLHQMTSGFLTTSLWFDVCDKSGGITVQVWFRHPNPGFALAFWVYDVIETDGKTLQLQKPRFFIFTPWICSLPSPHRVLF